MASLARGYKRAWGTSCLVVWVWFFLVVVQPSRGERHQAPPDGSAQAGTAATELRLPGCFHLAGVSGVKRNARGELVLTADSLTYERANAQALLVPYKRMRRVQVVSSHRVAAKTAVALALIPYVAPTSFVAAMTKQKYDAWVFQYETESGGLAGAVFHVPSTESKNCVEWLGRFGLEAEQYTPGPPPPERK